MTEFEKSALVFIAAVMLVGAVVKAIRSGRGDDAASAGPIPLQLKQPGRE